MKNNSYDWNNIPSELKEKILNELNNYHQTTMYMYDKLKDDHLYFIDNTEQIHKRNIYEEAICNFLNSINLPVSFIRDRNFSRQYFVPYKEDFIDEWVKESENQ